MYIVRTAFPDLETKLLDSMLILRNIRMRLGILVGFANVVRGSLVLSYQNSIDRYMYCIGALVRSQARKMQ